MGYDAFGLPAENHAISTGQHPRDSTNAAIKAFRRQFREWGISIDWSREFGTHEPRYYRWTQWIFLQLFEHGLAYRKEAAVKWCPNDQTVLANEQVIDGRCERCGAEVEAKQLEQWFFRITDYADRLLDDLDTVEWPEHVKTMQRNWIGRSEGAEVVFRCDEPGIDYPVFTTRPDTLFGATFFVMAPEHPDVERLARGTGHEAEVRRYVNHALNESSAARRTRRRRASSSGATSSTRSTASACRCTSPTTCSWSTAPARSWPCPRTTSVTTRSQRSSTCLSGASSPRPTGARTCRTRATARS
jgi:leucyl-tRNA synthetase